jgi:hypothetical protein
MLPRHSAKRAGWQRSPLTERRRTRLGQIRIIAHQCCELRSAVRRAPSEITKASADKRLTIGGGSGQSTVGSSCQITQHPRPRMEPSAPELPFWNGLITQRSRIQIPPRNHISQQIARPCRQSADNRARLPAEFKTRDVLIASESNTRSQGGILCTALPHLLIWRCRTVAPPVASRPNSPTPGHG